MSAPAAFLPSTATSPDDVVASFVLADPMPITGRTAPPDACPAAVPGAVPAAVPVRVPAAVGVQHTLGGGRPRTVLLAAAAAVLAYGATAAAGSVAIPAAPPGPGDVAAASDGTGSFLDRYVDQLLFRRCHPDWSPVSSCPHPHQHRGRAAEEHAPARSATGPGALTLGDLPQQGADR
jgi:hypothetical protein